MLSSYLTTPLGTSDAKDEAWVESGLAFLRSLAVSSSIDTPMIRALPNMDELVTALLNDICTFVGKDAAGKIWRPGPGGLHQIANFADCAVQNHPMFIIRPLPTTIRLDENRDGSHINFLITNVLSVVSLF